MHSINLKHRMQHQVQLIRAQMYAGSFGSLAFICVCLYLFYDLVDNKFHIILWATLASVIACINFIYAATTRTLKDQKQYQHALYFFTFLGGCTGILWGIPSLLIINIDVTNIEQSFLFVFIIIAVVGMSTSALGSTTAYLPMYYFSITPIMFSCIVACIINGQELLYFAEIAIVLTIFCVAIFVFAFNINRRLVESIELRQHNLILAESYQAQQRKAEQSSIEKSRFLAAASHDLRQPLYALSLYTEALQGEEDRKMINKLVHSITKTTASLRYLLNAILDLSMAQSNTLTTHYQYIFIDDVFEKSRQNFSQQAQQKGLNLSFVPSSLWIYSDNSIIERIVGNLIANAITYTESGKIVVGVQRRGKQLYIHVFDSGIGIADQDVECIFQEYYQVENSHRDAKLGLGLGLSIVKALAENIGCALSCRSILGRGSCFSLMIPAWQKNGSRADSTKVIAPVVKGGRILVVDDDPDILTACSILMRRWSLTVVCAEDFSQAIASINDGFMPDVIVSDFRLRNNENGINLLDKITKMNKMKCTGILITGDTDPQRLKEAQQSGYLLLHKPIEPIELRQAINQQILNKEILIENITSG